jgi:hypothetical protein
MLDKYINSYTLAMCRALNTIMVALKAVFILFYCRSILTETKREKFFHYTKQDKS